MHAICFEEWKKSLKFRGEAVTCVYCRAVWDAQKKISNEEGFLNLGKFQPELPLHRSYSRSDF